MSDISSDQKQPESISVQIDPPEGTNTLQNAEQGKTEELIEKEKITKIKNLVDKRKIWNHCVIIAVFVTFLCCVL
jgi:hypothetical protein